MGDKIKAILILLSFAMFGVGIILFFINLFDNSIGDAHNLRTKIFCGLMVGSVILGGISKAFGNDES